MKPPPSPRSGMPARGFEPVARKKPQLGSVARQRSTVVSRWTLVVHGATPARHRANLRPATPLFHNADRQGSNPPFVFCGEENEGGPDPMEPNVVRTWQLQAQTRPQSVVPAGKTHRRQILGPVPLDHKETTEVFQRFPSQRRAVHIPAVVLVLGNLPSPTARVFHAI